MKNLSQNHMQNLIPCRLVDAIFQECFPGCSDGDTVVIVVKAYGKNHGIGFLLIQDADPDTIGLHIHIFPEYRSTAYLRGLVRDFKPALLKYLNRANKSKMIVTCGQLDTHVKSLLRILGFSIQDVCIGHLDINA